MTKNGIPQCGGAWPLGLARGAGVSGHRRGASSSSPRLGAARKTFQTETATERFIIIIIIIIITITIIIRSHFGSSFLVQVPLRMPVGIIIYGVAIRREMDPPSPIPTPPEIATRSGCDTYDDDVGALNRLPYYRCFPWNTDYRFDDQYHQDLCNRIVEDGITAVAKFSTLPPAGEYGFLMINLDLPPDFPFLMTPYARDESERAGWTDHISVCRTDRCTSLMRSWWESLAHDWDGKEIVLPVEKITWSAVAILDTSAVNNSILADPRLHAIFLRGATAGRIEFGLHVSL